MPYTRPDFSGAFLNFMLLLKLGAPSRLGTRGKLRSLPLPYPVGGPACTHGLYERSNQRAYGTWKLRLCNVHFSNFNPGRFTTKIYSPFGLSPVNCTNTVMIANVLLSFPPANSSFAYTLSLT